MIIAFDVDGTLINFDNTPNYEVIEIYRWFQKNHHRMIIWSGGGYDYADHWSQKLGLEPYAVFMKDKLASETCKPDICFDDEVVQLAKVNIKINPRLKTL